MKITVTLASGKTVEFVTYDPEIGGPVWTDGKGYAFSPATQEELNNLYDFALTFSTAMSRKPE